MTLLRIRKDGLPIYWAEGSSRKEQTLKKVNSLLNHAKKPFLLRAYIKYRRNALIHLIRPFVSECFRDMHLGCRFECARTYPISLTKDDVILALKNAYKEETEIDINFSKDLKSKLSKAEEELAKRDSRRELKSEYKYLLEIIDEIKNSDESK